MNREDIIRMAREAGLPRFGDTDEIFSLPSVIRFANLVAAAEREACALAAEAVVPRHTECGNKIAAAIRARGQE
jgi:hypothetical protein